MDSNVAQVQRMQKKTSTMSLTISSSSSSSSRERSSSSSSTLPAQRHSSLVHPLCVSPQRTQSPVYNQQYSGKGVAPTFVKCLHDMSTVKGQLVVLECRLRGTPPLQVMWYREDEQIQDSDDFRILRKKGSSASVPEELCTLVITEAFPEDSGLFKCVVLNSYGTVSCSATLEVYNDLEEQLEVEAIRQQEALSLSQEDSEAEHHEETTSFRRSIEDFPPVLPDCMNLPPPEWPDSPLEDSIHGGDLPEPEPISRSEEPLGRSEEESALSSEGQRSPDDSVRVCTPSPLPPSSPPAQVKEKTQTPKLFTPSKLSFTSSQSGGNNMSLSDLPSFTPGAFPPSAFNYERPRHFIQSQTAFQAPSYESVLREAQENQNNQQNLSSTQSVTEGQMKASHTQSFSPAQSVSRSVSQTQSQFQSLSLSQNQTRSVAHGQIQTQANGTAKSSPSSSGLNSPTSTSASSAAPPFSSSTSLLPSSTSSSSLPRATMRSTITLTPRVPSASGLGSASLPANQDTLSASAAYLCSVLPSPSSSFSSKLSPSSSLPHPSTSPSCSPLAPSSPLLPMRTSASTSSLPHQPLPVSPSLPHCPSSSSLPQKNNQSRVQPTVVSLPAGYKGTPNTLPKPILKKSVAPRPSSSRSIDEDIQGSKDALIQDLEKKLRSKEARRRHSQKLSYEERMARRLLGPDNATYMLDQDNLSDLQLDQSDSPEGRRTGGLWGRHHLGTDERTNEGSAIQEKCFAPRFLQIPPDLTVEEGRFCRIDFKVSGLPAPDISWYLDGKAIRPDDYHKMLVCEKGMHSFIIEIVTVHHAGVYECVAKNRAGESRFTMRLDVIAQEALRPPTFVQKMLNTRALEGDTVRLECKVDASPPPQLFWKKDKDMLRIDPNRMSLYQDGSGRQCLLIDRVTKSDSGWYTLSAINEAGMSTCNARLDVGTRTTPALKTAPPASKTLKLLSSLSHVPALTAESPAQHTAPLYESEEL